MTKVRISWSELAGASERVNLSPWSGHWKTPACKTKGINKWEEQQLLLTEEFQLINVEGMKEMIYLPRFSLYSGESW